MTEGTDTSTDTTESAGATETTAETTQTTTAGATQATAADWKSSIPEDIRANPSIAKFMASDSLEAFAGTVAKSYVNASQMIGRDKVPLPKTDEDWEGWYEAAGRPKTAAEYELSVPDGVPEGIYENDKADLFKEQAHKAGLNGRQAQELHDWFVSTTSEEMARSADEGRAKMEAAEAALKSEWGRAYDQKLAAAKKAAIDYGGEGLAQWLESSGQGNNPHFVKAFARVAEATKGDDALVGTGQDMAQTPAQIDAEIGEYRARHAEALNEKVHPGHKAAVAGLSALYNKRHPEG